MGVQGIKHAARLRESIANSSAPRAPLLSPRPGETIYPFRFIRAVML